MKRNLHRAALNRCFSSVLMLALLSWLMVCLPLVHESHKAAKAQTQQSSEEIETEEEQPSDHSSNENAGSGFSPLPEYLYDASSGEQHFVTIRTFFEKFSFALEDGHLPKLFIPPLKGAGIGSLSCF